MIAFVLLILSASLCLGLSYRVATRWLGFLAAGATLLSGLALLGEHTGLLVVRAAPIVWAQPGEMTAFVSFELAPANVALALVLMGGGVLSFAALSMALDSTVRGFGLLFAWMLLAIASVLFALMSTGLLLPLAWAVTVLSVYSAVRSSGVLYAEEHAPLGVSQGLLASLLLLVGIIAAQSSLLTGGLPDAPSVLFILLACLMLVGSILFHHVFDETVKAPTEMGGLLYGVVLPVLALGTLFRFVADPSALLNTEIPLAVPAVWRSFLLFVGILTMVGSAAGALRQHHLRRLLAYQVSGQAGAVLIALSLQHPLAAIAAWVLLINLVLTTLAGALASAVFGHLTGSDDFTQDLSEKVDIHRVLRVPGLIWSLAAISAIGMPPFWGFWGRLWLFEALFADAAWVILPFLAASSLAALAYLTPLARFWFPERSVHMAQGGGDGASGQPATTGMGIIGSGEDQMMEGGGTRPARKEAPVASESLITYARSPLVSTLLPVLALTPLLLFGLAPQLAWRGGLQFLSEEMVSLPVNGMFQAGCILVLLVGGGLVLAIWQTGWKRRALPDEDMVAVVLAPDTLAESLLPLAWLSRPVSLMNGLWDGLQTLYRWVQLALSPFEQRYYLAGVLLALISLIVLMAQG